MSGSARRAIGGRMRGSAVKPNRHPKRTWFGDTPVRTLADAEAENRVRSTVEMQPNSTRHNAGSIPAGRSNNTESACSAKQAQGRHASQAQVIPRQAEHGTGGSLAQGARAVRGDEPKQAAGMATDLGASTHAAGATSPTPEPATTPRLAISECQQQAQSLFADRLMQPEQIRAKYPAGWVGARYVLCSRRARVRADGVPVLFDVAERAEGGPL